MNAREAFNISMVWVKEKIKSRAEYGYRTTTFYSSQVSEPMQKILRAQGYSITIIPAKPEILGKWLWFTVIKQNKRDELVEISWDLKGVK